MTVRAIVGGAEIGKMTRPRRTQAAWRAIETLVNVGNLGAMTDGQLLDHFRRSRDPSGQDAFRVLVDRHGAMVLALCQSLVSDCHEAEDAFQATFLVLVHKADSIRNRETIGPWLYGVAGRVARRARARSLRRRRRELVLENAPAPGRTQSSSPTAEQIILDEIARLPDVYRAPVVLCCLEQKSYDVAAQELGVSHSTLRGRLHRARNRLETQLRNRGVLLSAPILALLRTAEPALIKLPRVPDLLGETAVQFSSRWSSVRGLLTGAAAVPESIAALAKGTIHAMVLQTFKFAAIAIILSATVLSVVVVGQGQLRNNPGPAPAATGQNAAGAPAQTSGQVAQPVPRNDVKTKQLLAALEEPVAMQFANATPLDDVLKYIKQATTSPTYSGIPIYVNPDGLREAKRSLNSTIQINQEHAPLRTSLYQILKPLGLSYVVRDGFLMIDSRANVTEIRLEEVDRKLDRVLDALQRLEGGR
jgi:RNA polymerase sigma factor (sigma-70 family)